MPSERPASVSSPVAAGVRGALDALVQAALVELFQAYDVAMAPLPRTSARRSLQGGELCAAITFSNLASGKPGKLTLIVPSVVLELIRRVESHASHEDWLRELANQLLGRIKNRLLHFSVNPESEKVA